MVQVCRDGLRKFTASKYIVRGKNATYVQVMTQHYRQIP